MSGEAHVGKIWRPPEQLNATETTFGPQSGSRFSTTPNPIKTPLTSCGLYVALNQRWEQARASADPPLMSVPPTRSRVSSQERFAFPILLAFGQFACPMAMAPMHCRRCCLFCSSSKIFWARWFGAHDGDLEPQDQDTSASASSFLAATFFIGPYPPARGDSRGAPGSRHRPSTRGACTGDDARRPSTEGGLGRHRGKGVIRRRASAWPQRAHAMGCRAAAGGGRATCGLAAGRSRNAPEIW